MDAWISRQDEDQSLEGLPGRARRRDVGSGAFFAGRSNNEGFEYKCRFNRCWTYLWWMKGGEWRSVDLWWVVGLRIYWRQRVKQRGAWKPAATITCQSAGIPDFEAAEGFTVGTRTGALKPGARSTRTFTSKLNSLKGEVSLRYVRVDSFQRFFRSRGWEKMTCERWRHRTVIEMAIPTPRRCMWCVATGAKWKTSKDAKEKNTLTPTPFHGSHPFVNQGHF